MSDLARILVTTDFSAQSMPSLAHAALLARKFGSEVSLLYVVEDRLPPVLGAISADERQQVLDKYREQAAAKLEEYVSEHLAALDVKTHAVIGVAPQEIVRFADEHQVDLIVMASRGYGPLRQLLLGSTAERVLHHASCPVLMVPSKGG